MNGLLECAALCRTEWMAGEVGATVSNFQSNLSRILNKIPGELVILSHWKGFMALLPRWTCSNHLCSVMLWSSVGCPLAPSPPLFRPHSYVWQKYYCSIMYRVATYRTPAVQMNGAAFICRHELAIMFHPILFLLCCMEEMKALMSGKSLNWFCPNINGIKNTFSQGG